METVTKDGCRLKIAGKVFEIFRLLLEAPQTIVTRETIRVRLWPNSPVDVDANITSTVNKLRRTLGDSCYDPEFIRTIPGKGYLLLGRPEFSDEPKEFTVFDRNGKAEAQTDTQARIPGRAKKNSPTLLFFPYAAVLFLLGILLGAGIVNVWLYAVGRAQPGLR